MDKSIMLKDGKTLFMTEDGLYFLQETDSPSPLHRGPNVIAALLFDELRTREIEKQESLVDVFMQLVNVKGVIEDIYDKSDYNNAVENIEYIGDRSDEAKDALQIIIEKVSELRAP
jgi:hypothetical protein